MCYQHRTNVESTLNQYGINLESMLNQPKIKREINIDLGNNRYVAVFKHNMQNLHFKLENGKYGHTQ